MLPANTATFRPHAFIKTSSNLVIFFCPLSLLFYYQSSSECDYLKRLYVNERVHNQKVWLHFSMFSLNIFVQLFLGHRLCIDHTYMMYAVQQCMVYMLVSQFICLRNTLERGTHYRLSSIAVRKYKCDLTRCPRASH